MFWLMVSGDIGLWWGESRTGSRVCAPIFSDVRGPGGRELRLELGLTCNNQMCIPGGLSPPLHLPSHDKRFHSLPEQHHQLGPTVHTQEPVGNILQSAVAYANVCEEYGKKEHSCARAR